MLNPWRVVKVLPGASPTLFKGLDMNYGHCVVCPEYIEIEPQAIFEPEGKGYGLTMTSISLVYATSS